MKIKPIIRKMKLGDIEKVIPLAKQLHDQHRWSGQFNASWKKRFLKRAICDTKNIAFVALWKRQIIAYILGVVKPEPAIKKNIGLITELFVDTKHREQGIGTLIFEVMEKNLEKHQTYEILANVAFKNKSRNAMQKILTKFGYVKRSLSYTKTVKDGFA